MEAFIWQGTQKITLLQKLGIMIDVCGGLHHAHERGVIHRDIKPANVMVRQEDGLAKIVDFGIARVGGKSETQSGLIGTVEYMSPEQLLGKVMLDRRTENFSTACSTKKCATIGLRSCWSRPVIKSEVEHSMKQRRP